MSSLFASVVSTIFLSTNKYCKFWLWLISILLECFLVSISSIFSWTLSQVLPPCWAFPVSEALQLWHNKVYISARLNNFSYPVKILQFVFFVSIVVPGTTVSVKVSPSAHLLRRVACPGRRRKGCNSPQGKKQFKAECFKLELSPSWHLQQAGSIVCKWIS